MGKIFEYICEVINMRGSILFGLIDPDGIDEDGAGEFASEMAQGGADIILIGGSTGAEGEVLSTIARSIKERISIPLIIFPGNAGAVSRYADAIYYMNIKNTNSAYWGIEFPVLMAPLVKKAGIEPLPVSYIVLEPGQTAGWVSRASPIPRAKPQLAAICALSGEYSGSRLIVMDSGSGSPLDVPFDIISRVSREISVPLIYAGGVRTPDEAREVIASGAQGIQIGTAAEKDLDREALFQDIRVAMDQGYRSRGERTCTQSNIKM